MNFLKAVGSPITQKIGDKDVVFRPLTLEQAGELMAVWAKADREALIADMTAASEEPKAITRALREHAWETSRLSYGLMKAQTAQGVRATLATCSGQNPASEITLTSELIGLVMKLWGHDMEAQQSSDPKATGQPSNATG